MTTTIWTLEYLYRDASNYKSWGSVFIEKCSELEASKIRTLFEANDNVFVAEQINFPLLYDGVAIQGKMPSDDNHAYHEFFELRQHAAAESGSCQSWGTAENLISELESIGDFWNVRLSSHCAALSHDLAKLIPEK